MLSQVAARSTSRRCRWRFRTASSWTSARMEIGDTLRLADLPPQEGVTFLDDPGDRACQRDRADPRSRSPSPEVEEARGASWPRARKPRGRRRGRAEAARRPARAPGEPGPPRANVRLFRRGEGGLDARPARRGARQSRPRATAHAPQRRLDGRRRARPPARRLVPGEVPGQLAEVRLDGLRLALSSRRRT